MTDSEKLDILLKEVHDMKGEMFAIKDNVYHLNALSPMIKRIDKQVKLISGYLLAPSEIQKVKNAK